MVDSHLPFSHKKPPDAEGSSTPGSASPGLEQAGWARDIRQLYKSVAEEPVPAEFQSLMDQIARKIAK